METTKIVSSTIYSKLLIARKKLAEVRPMIEKHVNTKGVDTLQADKYTRSMVADIERELIDIKGLIDEGAEYQYPPSTRRAARVNN